MTRPLGLSEREVTVLCRGAAKAGFVAEVKIGKVLVRLIPENHPSLAQADRPIDREEDIRL